MLTSILLLPLLHYIADFELQNNWMALGKSKRLLPLLAHVTVYAGCFGLVFGWQFGVVTFATHFLTDFVTSRWTSKLWFLPLHSLPSLHKISESRYVPTHWTYDTGTRHRFFCVIGLDQMIHSYTLLFSTLYFDVRPFWL